VSPSRRALNDSPLAAGAGSEVMRRIAAPMVGGMVTAPLLSLFVIPAIYPMAAARGRDGLSHAQRRPVRFGVRRLVGRLWRAGLISQRTGFEDHSRC